MSSQDEIISNLVHFECETTKATSTFPFFNEDKRNKFIWNISNVDDITAMLKPTRTLKCLYFLNALIIQSYIIRNFQFLFSMKVVTIVVIRFLFLHIIKYCYLKLTKIIFNAFWRWESKNNIKFFLMQDSQKGWTHARF